MGIIYSDLRLANDARDDLEEISVSALVDTGALHLCIPEHVELQLQLKTVEMREVILADGQSRRVRYVSPVRIELLNRHCVTGALVFGNQVLLGAIPMDDMNLIIEPARLKVSVNPRAPNIPLSMAKGNKPAEFQPRMLWRVVAVEALPDFRLRVRFVDGTEGEVDLAVLVHSPGAGVFASLADSARFAQVFVEHGAVTWPGEIDLAPDAMYAAIKKGVRTMSNGNHEESAL